MTLALKIGILAALALAIGGVLSTKNRGPTSSMESDPQAKRAARTAKKSKPLPKLLDLGSEKCVPCRAMFPVLASLQVDYKGKLRVEFIDVWKEPAAAGVYKVTTIPTQIFFDAKGKEVYRHVGFYSKADIVAKMKKLGFGL